MHWLSILGAIPLVGTVIMGLLPRGENERAKQVALGTSLVALVWTIIMATRYHPHGDHFQLKERADWIPAFGVHYAVGVDGIALVLIGLTAVLVPVVLLASWHDAEPSGYSVRTFFALMLVTETLLVGVFAATDVFLFYVFFEAMLIPMYFIIGRYGGPKRSYAAVKFLIYSLTGGLLMLAAVIGLYVVSTHQLPAGTFDLTVLSTLHISPDIEKALFLGFFIAFAIKAPLWPFHTWLPDAAAEAPTGVAVMLVGVLDKVGTSGFLRYCIPLFPDAARQLAPYILGLCVMGILYGALLAVGQRDMKRLVAYSSVSHFGFIALGIFAFTSQGGSGATLYMVNHAFSTGALFLLVGFLATRRGSRLIDDFGGAASVAPWLGAMFLIAGLSALSLPGLSTFVSEFLVLLGPFTVHRWFAVVATFGIVLAAVYVLWMVQRTIHGPVREGIENMRDLSLREAWVIAPVMAVIVVLGVYPQPLLDVINPAVHSSFTKVRPHDPAPSQLVNSALLNETPQSSGGTK